MNQIKLICFPFAGGGRYSYRIFNDYVSSKVKLDFIDLPGRGARTSESLLTSMDDVVEDVYASLKEAIIPGEDFAFFGHSMGALVSYLTTLKMRANGDRLPLKLFLSGRRAPSIPTEKKTYTYPKADFIEEVRDIGGSTEEVLQNEELMNYYEPILRADFQVVEDYRYSPAEPLTIPMSVLMGTEESFGVEEALQWRQESTHEIEFREFKGGHFFIFDFPDQIMNMINDDLLLNSVTH